MIQFEIKVACIEVVVDNVSPQGGSNVKMKLYLKVEEISDLNFCEITYNRPEFCLVISEENPEKHLICNVCKNSQRLNAVNYFMQKDFI